MGISLVFATVPSVANRSPPPLREIPVFRADKYVIILLFFWEVRNAFPDWTIERCKAIVGRNLRNFKDDDTVAEVCAHARAPLFVFQDGRELRRGVLFYLAGDQNIHKATVFEWMDLGDGGCPCFSVKNELEFVRDDLYRTKGTFIDYVNGQKMSTVGELNWNIHTNEFAYREIYTPAE